MHTRGLQSKASAQGGPADITYTTELKKRSLAVIKILKNAYTGFNGQEKLREDIQSSL